MLDKGTDLIKCKIFMQNKKVPHHQVLLHDHSLFHNFRTIRQGLGDITVNYTIIV